MRISPLYANNNNNHSRTPLLLLLLAFLPLLSFSVDGACDEVYSFTHDWMGKLYNISTNHTAFTNYSATAWPYRRLNEILVPGSHDGGLWTIVQKSALGVFFPDNVFITQTRNFHDQSCAGSRFYDVRFSKALGVWHIFHSPTSTGGSAAPAAYGVDIDTACKQIIEFLDDPSHSREIIVWRIKIEDTSMNEEISSILRSKLIDYMIDFNGSIYYNLTLSQIWGPSPTKGKIIILSYYWTPSPLPPGEGPRGTIFDYPKNQLGQFTDANTLQNMLGRCDVGQIVKLFNYKAANVSDHPLYGIWWTYTTEDIKQNTMNQWNQFPNALNDFYFLSNGEIGNVLVVDFFGDYSSVMKIVWDYNFNKFASFPPVSPMHNYVLLGHPDLPDKSVFTDPSTCLNVGGATAPWVTNIIIITVFVILAIVFLFCVTPCIAFYCYKNKKGTFDYSLTEKFNTNEVNKEPHS